MGNNEQGQGVCRGQLAKVYYLGDPEPKERSSNQVTC